AVARAALAHAAEPLATVQALRAERDKLVDWLRGQGLTVADSDANFVLFGGVGDAPAGWQGLRGRGGRGRGDAPPPRGAGAPRPRWTLSAARCCPCWTPPVRRHAREPYRPPGAGHQGDLGGGRGRPRRDRHRPGEHRGAVLRPYARAARQARPARPGGRGGG